MEDSRSFVRAGIRPAVQAAEAPRRKWYRGRPVWAMVILGILFAGCLGCDLFIPRDPSFMDLAHFRQAPGLEFWFGTDTMGRDIFSMIWSGGRLSLLIGFLSAAVSAVIALIYGTASGVAPGWLDGLMMRLAEILLAIPNLLFVILLQAALGGTDAVRLAVVIGASGWMSMAKVVRAEVLRLRTSGYVVAACCMGGSFFHILWKHLTPNLISSMMFMAVMNVRGAIAAESTLSFMGLGLPVETVSWGSMLSLAEQALLSGDWWMILFPGLFLAAALLCVTELGNDLRRIGDRRESNL